MGSRWRTLFRSLTTTSAKYSKARTTPTFDIEELTVFLKKLKWDETSMESHSYLNLIIQSFLQMEGNTVAILTFSTSILIQTTLHIVSVIERKWDIEAPANRALRSFVRSKPETSFETYRYPFSQHNQWYTYLHWWTAKKCAKKELPLSISHVEFQCTKIHEINSVSDSYL